MKKATGGDKIPVALFQMLKDDVVKVLASFLAFSVPGNLENSAVATGLEKVSFHSNPKERQCQRMFKLPYNCLISHTSKVMLKFLQARLQQYLNQELPDVKLDLEQAQETEIKLPPSIRSQKKQEN